MDYKEKYEMALEGIQEILGSGEDSIKMSRLQLRLQGIFPELKESEDERIRKAIHIYLDWLDGKKDYAPRGEYTINDMIDWIEKQGKHQKFRDSIQVGDKVTRNEDGVLVNLSQLKRVAKKDDKQGEQKPIISNNALREGITHFGITQYQIDNWLKKYVDVEKQGEQESAEFDDANAKRMFIKALERVEEQNNKGYKLTDCDKNSWWEDFKAYTSCTVEQKPAEWSEEDEVLLKLSLENLTELKDRFGKEYGKVGDCIIWLESIRPQNRWKPSDEQITWLYRAADEASKDSRMKQILNELLFDLKKLMEE